ncbi:DUF3085 domain-containing protein [Mesorhizobium sp. A556]
MFTFPIVQVRAIIARGQSDAAANGGFRNPHYGLDPGKDEKPDLWLVGDQGVYIMSNGILAEGVRPLVCYALECNPADQGDWGHYKERHFGGDDGIEFLDAAEILRLLDADPGATHLRVVLSENEISLMPVALPHGRY